MRTSGLVHGSHVLDNAAQDGTFRKFIVRLHHGGKFSYHPKVVYVGGLVEEVILDKNTFSLRQCDSIYKGLGYKDYSSYFFSFEPNNLDQNLELMSTPESLKKMVTTLCTTLRLVDIFCRHSDEYQLESQKEKGKGVAIDEDDDSSSALSGSGFEASDEEMNETEWVLPSQKAESKNQNEAEKQNEEINRLLGLNMDEMLAFNENDELLVSSRRKQKQRVRTKMAKNKAVINEDVEEVSDGSDPNYVDDSSDFSSLDDSDGLEEEDPRYGMGSKKVGKGIKFDVKQMNDPKFEIGMEFTDFKEFREAIKHYAVKHKKGIWIDKSERLKVSARCKEGCGWYIYGSQHKGGDNVFAIRTFVDNHSCSNVVKTSIVNSSWVGKKYSERYILNPTWPNTSFYNTVNSELELDISKSIAYRALQFAKKQAVVTIAEQFRSLFDYKEELLRSNAGSTVDLVCTYEGERPIFSRIYVCLGGLKKGFLEGCRSLIGMDGCFLKGQMQGMILAAVGIDANDGMWPFAYAVVEGETKETWTWFLEHLRDDIACVNSFHFTFISDKQKGLVPSLESLFPNAELRFCVKHLHDNFKLQFRGNQLKKMLYACAKATYVGKFESEMKKLKEHNEEAYNWLATKEPSQWCRAFFSTRCQSDLLLNNHSETFNGCILKARSMEIVDLLESIRLYLMTRLQKNREKMREYTGLICPRVQERLEKYKKDSHVYIAVWAGVQKYQIRGMWGSQFVVDLERRQCSCRRWELSGIPCPHAICALNMNNLESEQFVAECYRKETYMRAYENMVFPIQGQDQWPKSGIEIFPPRQEKSKGRKRMRRIRQKDEGRAKPHKQRQQQDTVRCSICKQEYHNARTCPRRANKGQEDNAGVINKETPTQASCTTTHTNKKLTVKRGKIDVTNKAVKRKYKKRSAISDVIFPSSTTVVENRPLASQVGEHTMSMEARGINSSVTGSPSTPTKATFTWRGRKVTTRGEQMSQSNSPISIDKK